jgi:hypothetical protein
LKGFSLLNNCFSITYFIFPISERYIIVLLLISSHVRFVPTSASLQKYSAGLHAERASIGAENQDFFIRYLMLFPLFLYLSQESGFATQFT